MAILKDILTGVRRLQATPGRGRLALVVIAAMCVGSVSAAIDVRLPEDRVKAAFLYNFARFVEWPPDAIEGRDALIICILRDEQLGDEVARAVEGKTIAGRPLEVRLAEYIDEVEMSHIVFVGRAAGGETDAILAALADRHVLTVSEVEEFVGRGGVIGLYKTDNKLRFRINIGAARNAGLEVSSKLLGLAEVVQGPVVRVER